VKGREEAESEILRQRAWDWFENVALTRLAPGGCVILMMTRWHELDLAGTILAKPSPLAWRVLSMPAISEGKGDPLGRPAGEEFPSIRGREPGYYTHRRATTSPYVWSAIYGQQPTAAVGNFFRRQAYRYWRPVVGVPDPAVILAKRTMHGAWIDLEGRRVDLTDHGVWRFATCDLAASEKTSADWTVVSVWAIDREGDLILLDRSRAQVEMADHFTLAKPLRDRWRYDVLFVPREYWSKTLIIDARAAGIPVNEVTTDKDKLTRAIPAAGRLHAGKVWFPGKEQAPWLDTWESELASFPRGAHDDQVDTFSAAARVAAAHWVPPPPPSRPPPPAHELAAIAAAHAAATGNGDHPPDIMTMPLG
jgi:predicted phage terminase large subunit-like protein